MKTNLTIIILLSILPLTICCEGEKGDDDTNDRTIRLNAGVTTLHSKAAITEGSFDATVAGWESASSTPDYTSTPTWVSAPTTITIGSTNNLTLQENPQYNTDNSVKTFITAWYPQGIPSEAIIPISSLQGEVDVMYAKTISGSLGNKIKQPLTFNHLLTQFKFIVAKSSGWDDAQKLQSITIDNARLPKSLHVGTGTIPYSSSASLVIPSITDQTLSTTPKQVGTAVMIAPVTGNTLPLTIVTNNGTQEQTFQVSATTDDTDYMPGKAYSVTLTFNDKNISISATVTPWQEGTASGSVTL